MKTPSRFLLLLSLFCFSWNASAADVELEGSRLLVTGMLDGSAMKAFTDALATGKVRTVVLEDSLGGTAEVARDYARAIQAAGVNTEARGQCHAACAYAFLAGKEHRFGRGLQVHGLLIPLSTRPTPGDLISRWRGDEAAKTLAEFTTSPGDGPAGGTLSASASTPTPTPPGASGRASAGNRRMACCSRPHPRSSGASTTASIVTGRRGGTLPAATS